MMESILRWSILSFLCQGFWSFTGLETLTPHPHNGQLPASCRPSIPAHRPRLIRNDAKSTIPYTTKLFTSSSFSPAEDQPAQNGKKAPTTNQTRGERNTTMALEKMKLINEAEKLRERAREIRAEAMAEENLLMESRSSTRRQRIQESDNMIDRLFGNVGLIPVNSTLSEALEEQIASTLRSERWSPQQVIMVLERLQERQIRVQDQPSIMTPSQAAVTRPSTFQIGDTRNAAVANETEWTVIDVWIASLINAATRLDDEYNDKMTASGSTTDPKQSASEETYNTRWSGRVAVALKSRRKEMIRAEEEELKRKIAANVNAMVRANKAMAETAAITTSGAVPDDIQEYTRQTLGIPSGETESNQGNRLNVTRVIEGIQSVPLWVPANLLLHLAKSKATLRKEDVGDIKERVLVGSRFFCTSSDAIPSAAIFRGNIRNPVGLVDVAVAGASESERNNHTAVVLEEIQQRMEAQGIAERVQIFLMEDPEWRPGKDPRVPKPLPVLIAIPRKVEPTESAMEKITTSKVAKRVSIALTLLATYGFSLSCHALNPGFFKSVVTQSDSVGAALACLPLVLGIFSVQVIHEAAHYLVAKVRKIKIGRPTPLPSPLLGTFGCITPLLSFPKNRTALFDLAFSGPVAAMVVSLLMMFGGAHLTIHASEAALSRFPVVPFGLFKCSLLTSMILSVAAPKMMMLPLAQPVPIHPLFLSGFAGLISSALNLLPIFRLDGGRIMSTLFGARFTGISSASVLLFMMSLVISGSSGLALTWGLAIVFLQRRTEVPVRDDVTPVDDVRFGAWVGAILAAVLALAPFPGGPGFL